MARSMDERCAVLKKHLSAHFYPSLAMYRGHAFLQCWETKEHGEVGPLLQPKETREMWAAHCCPGRATLGKEVESDGVNV